MKKLILTSCFLLAPAFALFAQGPRGGPGGGPGGGPMGGRGMGMMGGPQAFVTGAPYSAVQVVQRQETLSDGNSITHNSQLNVYRDSQGRVRTEETITPRNTASGQQPHTIATIFDFVGGHRYVLDSSTMTAFESPLHTPHAPPAGATANGRRGGGGGAEANAVRPNVVTTKLAQSSVNGVIATGTQHSESIPAGTIGNARPIQTSRQIWESVELKVPVKITSTDPRFGSSQMDLTNIVQAEPSAALFVVPAGYTLKSGGGPGRPGGPGGPGGMMRGARPAPPAQQ
jgi:hypothetical protein